MYQNRSDKCFLKSTYTYPFGMMMSGRTWEAGSSHRYGFNGKEQDSEPYGEGNIYDYGFRIYNPRISKFLSVDPLIKKYAYLTPYQFASNSPIMAIDLDGLEAWVVIRQWSREDIFGFQKFVQTEINKIDAAAISGEINKNTCFDCADFAVHLIIQYAEENGLPIAFTDVNGNPIESTDTKFNNSEQFEDQVRGWTSATSLKNNDMVRVEGSPLIGDMTNSGSHINVVRPYDERYDAGYDEKIPTISGTLPQCCDEQGNPTEPSPRPFGGVLITKDTRYSHISQGYDYFRWDELSNVASNLPTERIETVITSQIKTNKQEHSIKQSSQ